MSEPCTTRTSDVQVIVDEDQLDVVLGGLPPDHARGLQTLLHGTGVVVTVIQDLGRLGVLLRVQGHAWWSWPVWLT